MEANDTHYLLLRAWVGRWGLGCEEEPGGEEAAGSWRRCVLRGKGRFSSPPELGSSGARVRLELG